MRQRARRAGETRFVWSDVYEEYQCEKCGKLIHYNFGFELCPYCGRKVAQTDERRVMARSSRTTGVIIR